MGIIERYDGIEWDDGNVWKNWEKHHVAPYETEQALRNEPFVEYDAEKYPGPEKRRIVKSRTDSGRYLFIVYTERNGRLRPICTRPMHESERKQYHEQTQTNP
ncbi:MAG TPA: BrnT family toxin [Candidatus Kapabacteria bacterium]|nr:BrnT family toxin [Candidatus Kapabacteria bacterium]